MSNSSVHSKYFAFNKNLGRPMIPGQDAYPQTNSEGSPVVKLTDEQRYRFDKDGWLLVPNVIDSQEIEEMREYIIRLDTDPD